jgi:hypothetical protein
LLQTRARGAARSNSAAAALDADGAVTPRSAILLAIRGWRDRPVMAYGGVRQRPLNSYAADPAAHRHQRLAKALAHGKLTNGANESTLSRARCAVPGFKS